MNDAIDITTAAEAVGIAQPKGLRAQVLTVFENIGIVLLITLVTLVLANSLSRYLFAAPLVWTEEVVKGLLMWLGALGITVAALRGGLIACSIWTARLSSTAGRMLGIFQNLFGIAVMMTLAVLAWKYLGIFGNDRSPLLGLPKGIAISGIIGCSAGLTLAFIIDLVAPEVPEC